jgi:hypothetical protein
MLQKSRILLSIVAVFRTLPLFAFSLLKAESNRTVLPEIVKIEEGKYEFGDIIINRNQRSITIPAVSNQRNGLVEYGLVHEEGKIHESLFRTKVRPQIFHTSLLLLKFKPVDSFFDNLWSDNPIEIDYSDKCFEILVNWEVKGKKRQAKLEDLSINQARKSPINQKSFIFTGSRIVAGTFLAESTGSILAIYADDNAIINNSHYDSTNDDVWIANKNEMPPLEIPVIIRFHLPTKNN